MSEQTKAAIAESRWENDAVQRWTEHHQPAFVRSCDRCGGVREIRYVIDPEMAAGWPDEEHEPFAWCERCYEAACAEAEALPETFWDEAVDPDLPPGVIAIKSEDGWAHFPLVEFMDEGDRPRASGLR